MRSIGHVEQQELIGLGAGNLDALDNDGETALILASRERNMEMVKFLHEAKADLNAYGRYGTALHRAVKNGHTEMLKVNHNKRTMDGLCCNDSVRPRLNTYFCCVAVCRD